MTNCAVAECTLHNRHKLAKEKEVSFHAFPKHPDIRAIWVNLCRRSDINLNNARICSEHFTEQDFMRDLRSELMDCSPRKRLKHDAIPSRNLPCVTHDPKREGEDSVLEQHKCVEELLTQSKGALIGNIGMDAIETMLDDVEEQLEEEVHAEEYFVNVSEIGQLIQEAQANDEDADVPNMEDSSMSMDETIHMEYQDESTSSNAEHETQDLACRYCGYESAHSRDYLEHEGIHTGDGCFTCNVCQFQCSTKKYLYIHYRGHAAKRTFECELCDYKSTKYSRVKDHQRIHVVKPFECTECDYKSSRGYNLKKHVLTVHSKIYDFNCDLCEYKTQRKDKYVRHLRKHEEALHETPTNSGIEPGQQRLELNAKTQEDDDGQLFSCLECSYKTTSKRSLYRHKVCHSEKRFVCKLCGYKTNRKSNLKDHEVSHTGLKPNLCMLCGNRFVRRSDLGRHYRQLHKLHDYGHLLPPSADKADDAVKHEQQNLQIIETVHLVEDDTQHIDENTQHISKENQHNVVKRIRKQIRIQQQKHNEKETYIPEESEHIEEEKRTEEDNHIQQQKLNKEETHIPEESEHIEEEKHIEEKKCVEVEKRPIQEGAQHNEQLRNGGELLNIGQMNTQFMYFSQYF